MQEIHASNPIRMNHVGFPCSAAKRFVMEAPDTTHFQIEYLAHTRYTVVFQGEMKPIPGSTLFEGDFSALETPGDYRICAGNLYSRHFVIHNRVYDMAERLMNGYFTLQRCGSPLGWAGMCHQEDGVVFETGEHLDLRGGYHQSCDLRKSFGGVPIGVIGLLRSAMNERPLWDQGRINDEIRWALDYYLKTVQPNGCVYNTLNAPLGWEGRVFFASGAPASAQWNVLSILLLGARIFVDDPPYCARLLGTARRIWDYMTQPDRSYEPYRHPDVLPRGMDGEFFYYASFRDSTSDLCGRLAAAVSFYRSTGEAKWQNEIESAANDLCACFVDGDLTENIAAGCLRLKKDDLRLMECTTSYGWTVPGIQALFDALDVMPAAASAGKWREMAGLIAEQRAILARKNPWRRAGSFISRESWDIPTGHPAPGIKRQILGDSFAGSEPAGYVKDAQGRQSQCYYKESVIPRPTLDMNNALIFLRAARILGRPDYLPLAQAQIDNLMGCNALDTCYIEGVGYNHYSAPVFGQFFPSTPKLPGAVHIGSDCADIGSANGPEYDMPCVGITLWALEELKRNACSTRRLCQDQHDIYWKK